MSKQAREHASKGASKQGSKQAREQASKQTREKGSKQGIGPSKKRQKFWAKFFCILMQLQAFSSNRLQGQNQKKSAPMSDTASGHTGRQFRITVLEREMARSRARSKARSRAKSRYLVFSVSNKDAKY